MKGVSVLVICAVNSTYCVSVVILLHYCNAMLLSVINSSQDNVAVKHVICRLET